MSKSLLECLAFRYYLCMHTIIMKSISNADCQHKHVPCEVYLLCYFVSCSLEFTGIIVFVILTEIRVITGRTAILFVLS